jgi:hypothetical protein
MSNKKTLTFKNTLYDIIDNGEIGNGWKYVEVLNKKHEFSLPQCLYYKGDAMKKLLTYSEYINHLDVGKDFMNDFVKDIFRECYPGSKNPICKVKESLMMGGGKIKDKQIDKFIDIIQGNPTISDGDIKEKYFKDMKEEERPVVKVDTLIKLKNEIIGMTEDEINDIKQDDYKTYNNKADPNNSGFNINVNKIKEIYNVLPKSKAKEDVVVEKEKKEEEEKEKQDDGEEEQDDGEEEQDDGEEEQDDGEEEQDDGEEEQDVGKEEQDDGKEEQDDGEEEQDDGKEKQDEEEKGDEENGGDEEETSPTEEESEVEEEPVVPAKYEANKELSEFMGDDKYLVASKKTEVMPENYLYLDYKLLTQSGNPFVLFSSGELAKETELYLKREEDFFKVEYGEKRTFDIDDISRSNEKINRLAKLIVRDVVKTKEGVDKLGEGLASLKELVDTFEKDEKNKNKTLFRKGYENIPPAPVTVEQAAPAEEEKAEEDTAPAEEEKGGEEAEKKVEAGEEKNSETEIEV